MPRSRPAPRRSTACPDRYLVQFVGLNVKPGRSIVTFTTATATGSRSARSATGRGDRQRRCIRVDVDRRANDDRAGARGPRECVGARLGGHHDRQAEGGTLVAFGEEDLSSGDQERRRRRDLSTPGCARSGFPGRRSLAGLGFFAECTPASVPNSPGGIRQLDAA